MQGATELLVLRPIEFRRVYTLNIEDGNDESDIPLKYSHSDIVVSLENGERAMVEIVQGLLQNGSYIVKCLPTDMTFDFRHTQKGLESMNWLKRIVFMNFPDLNTADYYGQDKLR
jgi:hypothetical protein